MVVAALIAWLITAGGGFVLLGTWLAKGGVRTPRTTRLPAPVIFGHFALAAAGLVVWIIFLIADTKALAWIALILLVPVAALGFTMLARWVGSRKAADNPPEKHFPIVVVGAHGLFAVATVVLVLISAIQA
jgi:hypothetical protein